jgi:hypothetical protein
MHAPLPPRTAPADGDFAHHEDARYGPTLQTLTLVLEGITTADYLQWVVDPVPPARDEVTLISTRSDLLGNRILLELGSSGWLPPAAAARAVGFPITPEVVAVHSSLRRDGNSQVRTRPHRARPDTQSPGGTTREGERWGQHAA